MLGKRECVKDNQEYKSQRFKTKESGKREMQRDVYCTEKIGPSLPTDEPSEARRKPPALFSHAVIHVLVRFPPTEFVNPFVLNNAS
jgi:hypothetical protein